MKLLTILTPAYNRAEYLPRLYRSLKEQTNGNFVWLIVDDGSTDSTEDLINGFIDEGAVEIVYRKKENGGKHTAVNLALDIVETELIMIALDTDDYLTPDAVEKVLSAHAANKNSVFGYVFMKCSEGGRLLCSKHDKSIRYCSWKEAVCEGRFDGEALFVFNSSYIRNYRYPVIEGEKFFTEAYVFLQLDKPLYWSHEAIYVAEYLEDGYSKNIVDNFVNNPVGYMMYNELRSGIFTSFAKRMKYFAYYDGFSMLSGTKGFVKKSAKPSQAVLALPLGFAFFLYLKYNKLVSRRKQG